MRKRFLFLLLLIAVAGLSVWAARHFAARKAQQQTVNLSNLEDIQNKDSWADAVEKVKADRGELAGGTTALEVPPELRHYTDRHWFLASQVAEVGKYNVRSCQDFVDLADMVQRGEMVTVPAVTDTYVLFGVGAKANDDVFTKHEDDQSVELYDEAQLGAAYRRIDDKRSTLQSEIESLKAQSGKLKKGDRGKQKELQKQIAARQEELDSTNADKALLDHFYGKSDSRQRLFREYESLQALAKNFAGRSYDIGNPADRQAMKLSLLSVLRPRALKILEEIAASYNHQFERPLPVSSLVRPEEYQRALRKVNRNAVLIDTPPHSTGLAFDIDYRYMSATEQNFLMIELARLKTAGRIEVIRERNANYHVFTFVNGTRPSDELISASLDEASAEAPQAHHASSESVRTAAPKSKSPKDRKAKGRTAKSRVGKRH